MTQKRLRLHASCVAVEGQAVLIRGPSGSGKSSLALRLIDEGGILVSDDQTIIEVRGGGLCALAPDTIKGEIEVRGLGIVDVASAGPTPLALIVDLVPAQEIARLPEAPELAENLLGQNVSRLGVDGSAADAGARIRLALVHFTSRLKAASPPLVSL